MNIRALELDDILELMAADIDYDNAFIRIDHSAGKKPDGVMDDRAGAKALYIGPFPLYEPYY
ncbi:MAG: hypothetical protein Q8L35_08330 [Actinomycetota bacterium]|nr:hypothetical protein [Actinomycetota bacterium]